MIVNKKDWLTPVAGCFLALSGVFVPILGPVGAIVIGLGHLRKSQGRASRALAKISIILGILAIGFFFLAILWPMHENW